ncbi:DUF6438 domain-containing protein [Pontibacter oryzae]|uniref:DUF6438 domain-containing protein n=1 Tax=Pontibacter oryzae TaxID=2304593 RepID=A0A399SET7_9BACT|nr:DUF6438 domain-containing protein [Pontibacter oryzae]RIJ41504.1 hypothetical protein D1627_05555 [Pontibacter oryzae]
MAGVERTEAIPILMFQKTPCYGTCPAYNATFYSNGKVYYEGLRYAPLQDTATFYLSGQQLHTLQKQLKDLKYTSLDDSYLSPYTDLPSSYFTFYQNGMEAKRVKHQRGGPDALQQFVTYLEGEVARLATEKNR